MSSVRLEVRLDAERQRKLREVAAARGVPVSEVVRDMIDRTYQEALQADRRRAAAELAQLDVEDVPDPQTLHRQLESTYATSDLP